MDVAGGRTLVVVDTKDGEDRSRKLRLPILFQDDHLVVVAIAIASALTAAVHLEEIVDEECDLIAAIDAPGAPWRTTRATARAAALIVHDRAPVIEHRTVERDARRKDEADAQAVVDVSVYARRLFVDEAR